MSIFLRKFFLGFLSTIILLNSFIVFAAKGSVVEREGIALFTDGVLKSLFGDGATNIPNDGDLYFQWEDLDKAGSYVLRIKGLNPEIDRNAKKLDGTLLYPSQDDYLNAACTKGFPSDEDSIPKPSPGNPVQIWFSSLTIGSIQPADTYCWKVRADFELDTVFNDTSWWTFSTELLAVPPPPPGEGGETIIDSGKLNPISAQNLTELFNKIFSFLFGLSIFIVPVIVIYAAYLMLMGGGDPVKLAKGRMILLWTAIAFILILVSKGLPVVFKNLL